MPNYLPDHLHCALALLPRDVDFANRIKAIKFRFVRAVAPRERRFRERTIRDETDYVCHLDYVHGQPGQTRLGGGGERVVAAAAGERA